MSDHSAYSTLRSATLFLSLTDDDIRDLAAICEPDAFSDGAWIFRAGDRGNAMWIVASGSIDVLLDSARHEPLASLNAFDVLGELSLIEPDLRSAGARARGDVLLYRIDFARFEALRDQLNPAANKLLRALSRLVCHRIRHVNGRIEDVARMSDGLASRQERRKTITEVLSQLWSVSKNG